MQAAEALGVVWRQRHPGLVAGDRLVLGAVILEDALQVLQARDGPQVQQEDRDPDELLDDHEHERVGQRVLDEARQPDGQQEEQPDRQRQRERDRAHPGAAGDRLLVVGRLRVGRDAERVEADLQRLAERDDAAHDRPAQPAVALEHRDQREALHDDLAARGLAELQVPAAGDLLGRRRTDGDGPRRDAAHHHALEHGLAADRGVPAGYEGTFRQPLSLRSGCQG